MNIDDSLVAILHEEGGANVGEAAYNSRVLDKGVFITA